jgi:sugar lactone lactonase YvrE
MLFVLFVSLFLQADDLHKSVIQTIAGSADENVLGTEFSFGALGGLATDTSGNVFFTIQALNKVYRLGIDGRVGPYAGNGIRGKHHDGALATESPLLDPSSLAVDSGGNLYIVAARALLRVDVRTHVIATVFTTPDRSSAAMTGISDVGPMIFGPTGLLYICEAASIKTYSFQTGSVTVVAGNGVIGATRTELAATDTPLKYPQSIAVAGDGTVYFSTLEHAVYRVGRDGRIGLLRLNLQSEDRLLDDYDNPHAIALDGVGHLLVAQGNRSRILCIDLKSGAVTVYAGTGKQGFNGDWIDSRSANITTPTYLTTDSDGNLVVGEQYRIRRIKSSDREIATLIGNGLPGSGDSAASGEHGRLWEPANVVAATDGSVYVTSSFAQRVARLNPGGTLVTLAGGGDPVRFDEPGPALEVSLNYPEGLWIAETGDIYFADNDNRIVRRLRGGWIENFAVTPKQRSSYGSFLYYAGALVGNETYLYLSDPNDDTVWRISRADGKVEVYVGLGSNSDVREKKAHPPKIVSPSGLALDASGNLYIADGGMNSSAGRILRVDSITKQTIPVISHLRQPSGLAFQSPNILCFSESGGNQVRCVDLRNRSVHVVAGTGAPGFSGDGGPAECAQLNRPSGIGFDAAGRLYIADTGNQRIRMVNLGQQATACQ